MGANVEEAHGSHSKPDFIGKMSIANKEARETLYWLRVLAALRYTLLSKLLSGELSVGELNTKEEATL